MECSERIVAKNPDYVAGGAVPRWLYCDVMTPGTMTIRGENVAICASVDLDKEESISPHMKLSEEQTVRSIAAEEARTKKATDAKASAALKDAGIEPGFGMQV
jgi:U6 snRNA-associated Sm-like protein LSm1